jgi:predicted phage baseplate assembly protein
MLPTPNLDDRGFQDIVDEARSLIPRYCPEWTDHNLSDPGITLIELFAWMMDMLLYRLNRVPDKNFVTFLDLIGVKLRPPSAAQVDITFRLSAPQPEMVTIPQGTEVATVRTESQEAITFSTDRNLRILVPQLIYCLTSPDGSEFTDHSDTILTPSPRFRIFEESPRPGNALYLGFQQDLSGNTLLLTMDCVIEGIGVDPEDAPLVWESWDGGSQRWVKVDVESDGTGALNKRGDVELHIPYSFSIRDVDLKRAWWVRCRLVERRPDQRTYSSSPRIRVTEWRTIGGTVPASHAITVDEDVLGRSEGKPGQVLALEHAPLLSRRDDETIEVETDEGWETWEEVEDFSSSDPDERHFVVDSIAGRVIFGPAIQQPSGETRQYGAIPPRGSRIRFTRYRYGGGAKGNVGRRTITVLKSSVPYVSSVTNRYASVGGADPETLESAKMRGPRHLRIRNRAVTAEDFEILAREAATSVARARCIQPEPDNGLDAGTVKVLIVPQVTTVEERIQPEQLRIPKSLEEEVTRYLDERRLLTTALSVEAPQYLWVSAQVHVQVSPHLDAVSLAEEIERRLYRFLNPLHGGPEGMGWPFGRDLFIADVYALVDRIEGVDYVADAKIFPVDAESGQVGDNVSRLRVPREGLICSYRHLVVPHD